jgi:DNA-binding response OmpR family regulator
VQSLRLTATVTPVARILIAEPHPDVRTLLELVVRRLGHEAIVGGGDDELDLSEVDAGVIEPGEGSGLPVARRLRALGRPVVFTSIFPADDETLGLEPAAYLVKPFALHKLESALAAALPTPVVA